MRAYGNSHPAFKSIAVVSIAITSPLAVGIIDADGVYAINNPTYSIGIVQSIDGYYGGSSPSVNLGTFKSAIESLINGAP